jgi:transporter family protein
VKPWLVYTLISIVLWGLWGFFPKLAVQHINASSAAVYEILGAIPLAILLAGNAQFRLDTHPRGVLFAVATGMIGFVAAFCFLKAVTTGPVTLVVGLSSLYPALTLLLAIFLLQETLSLRQGFGLALAIVAAALLAS